MSYEVAGFGFHEVTDRPGTTGFQRAGARPFTLSRQAFLRHLDAIADGPCHPQHIAHCAPVPPSRHLVLTFDDGGRSAIEAADELSRRGWIGHFFIVTGRIGTATFLDPRGIRYLHSCGHVVGSHSHSHPDIFRELPFTAMVSEWATSSALLADLLGAPCEAASVPGGEISPLALASGAVAGFRYLFTVEPELRPREVGECRVFGRYLVKAKTSPELTRRLARFQGWRAALTVRRLKAVARRAAPPLYRRVVAWRTQEA